jgi:demethylmenaquinone methyltransferase / 2-methoxy-6-polyprenyl-1,4-benzoquinol methylase
LLIGKQMEEKKKMVESMFNSIAWRYDFLNHFLSFGVDLVWRRRAITLIARHKTNPLILDVATGTGDLAIAALKVTSERIRGIDISENMLSIGRAKIAKKRLESRIELLKGDSEEIKFTDKTFDVTMVAFGVRNYSDPLKGLSEMCRVTKPGGMIMVLEFSRPQGWLLKRLYNFYFLKILPFFGRLFSNDKKAYNYLPDSVMKFPDNKEFLEILSKAGYADCRQITLSGGIASMYYGFKPLVQ